jgi:hypothetical protein
MHLISRVIKDICTNKNDEDYCHSKTLAFVAFVGFMVFTGYSIYRGDKFDPLLWAGGAGTIITAGAAGAKIKETTEPS